MLLPIVETIKDGTFMSSKYESKLKRLLGIPTVIIFCNNEFDLKGLSHDRINLKVISKDGKIDELYY